MALFISSNRSLGGLTFDATIQEDHESTVTITKNPVEFGADINDHRIIEPKLLTVEGAVSDYSLSPVDALSSFFSGSTSRSSGAWEDLINLQESGEPFNVQTGLKLYTNMLLTNLKTSQNKDSRGFLRFTANLQELRITNTELTQLSAANLAPGTTTSQATNPVNSGQIQTQAVPVNSSWLNTALTSLGV